MDPHIPGVIPLATELAAISVRMDSHKEQLNRIESHVRETNGRVGRLEVWRARLEGASVALRWVPPVATGVLTGVVVKLLA